MRGQCQGEVARLREQIDPRAFPGYPANLLEVEYERSAARRAKRSFDRGWIVGFGMGGALVAIAFLAALKLGGGS